MEFQICINFGNGFGIPFLPRNVYNVCPVKRTLVIARVLLKVCGKIPVQK